MTFDEWMTGKNPKYRSTDDTVALRELRECWTAARRDAFQLAAERSRELGVELAELNDDDSMEFAGRTIGDSICKPLAGVERECCGTFFRTPHRATCPKFRGKKTQNAEVNGGRLADRPSEAV